MKISVIIVEDSKPARKVRVRNDMDNFEKLIGGKAEVLRSGKGYAAICDANGWAKELPVTCSMNGIQLVGTVIFAGIDKEQLIDIPMTLQEFRKDGGIYLIEAAADA